MDNRDTLAILGTQDTERRQKKPKTNKQNKNTKHKTTQHRKVKRYIYDHIWHCVQSSSSESLHQLLYQTRRYKRYHRVSYQMLVCCALWKRKVFIQYFKTKY